MLGKRFIKMSLRSTFSKGAIEFRVLFRTYVHAQHESLTGWFIFDQFCSRLERYLNICMKTGCSTFLKKKVNQKKGGTNRWIQKTSHFAGTMTTSSQKVARTWQRIDPFIKFSLIFPPWNCVLKFGDHGLPFFLPKESIIDVLRIC